MATREKTTVCALSMQSGFIKESTNYCQREKIAFNQRARERERDKEKLCM